MRTYACRSERVLAFSGGQLRFAGLKQPDPFIAMRQVHGDSHPFSLIALNFNLATVLAHDAPEDEQAQA